MTTKQNGSHEATKSLLSKRKTQTQKGKRKQRRHVQRQTEPMLA